MSDHLQHELKKEFQLERMILFSDAVFAIAITLLVIEIKVPHLEGEITDANLASSLLHLIPSLFGFVMSFFIIGIYWTVHHKIFGFLENYDNKLIWYNLLFLFSIILMPFTSALYGEYYQPNITLPHIIYTANICFTGLWNALLVKHIADPKAKLSNTYADPHFLKLAYARTFMMPILFVAGVFVSLLYLPWVGRMTPMFMPLYMYLLN